MPMDVRKSPTYLPLDYQSTCCELWTGAPRPLIESCDSRRRVQARVVARRLPDQEASTCMPPHTA
jgi:hypothetical protein